MSRKWSHRDPTITLDGRVCHVEVAAWSDPDIGSDFSNYDTGPIDLEIFVPSGKSYSYTIDPGDNGYGAGYNIHFTVDSGLRCGTATNGTNWCQLSCIANIPANVDPATGQPWNLRVTLTPGDAQWTADTNAFRSGTPSSKCGPVRV